MTRVVAAALAVVVLAACGGQTTRSTPTRVQANDLVSLDSVLPLRAAFNAERGRPRLLLLLSPT